MKKIMSENGTYVNAVGQEGSLARYKEEYNNTIPALIYEIDTCFYLGGISRHADRLTLIDICNENEIFDKQLIDKLIETAYFYSVNPNEPYK